MNKTILGAALAAITLAGVVTAAGSVAAIPLPKPVPLGLRADADDQPTCLDDHACTIVKDQDSADPSCTGYSSQTTPPSTIKVLVQSVDPKTEQRSYAIQTLNFRTYLQNVLPNEWAASWDGDALKAGAVATKSYAWYWVNHFGGYIKGDEKQCFDVTDDHLFQVYQAGTSTARTNSVIDQTWPVIARKNGQVLQASFQRTLTGETTESCGAGANGQVLSQYGSQNCNDPDLGGNFANKYNVILQTYYGPDLQLATTAQLRTQHDFQYLHKSTPAVFANGTWTIADGYPTVIRLGTKGDVPVVNTVGDGFARVGLYRPSSRTWFLASPTGKVVTTFAFGSGGDVPVAAQYNGLSAPTQVAIWRPSNGTWYFTSPTGTPTSSVAYGATGEIPIPADYTGDGKADLAVFNPPTSRFYIRGQAGSVQWGSKGDTPIPADYTGDGKADIAVFHPATSTFYIRGQAAIPFGTKGDVPVTGDFTGDGKADIAVFRPSNHTLYVRGGSSTVLPAGTPIGAAPYHD